MTRENLKRGEHFFISQKFIFFISLELQLIKRLNREETLNKTFENYSEELINFHFQTLRIAQVRNSRDRKQ